MNLPADKATPSKTLEDELAALESQLEDAARTRREREWERERMKHSHDTPGADQDKPSTPPRQPRDLR